MSRINHEAPHYAVFPSLLQVLPIYFNLFPVMNDSCDIKDFKPINLPVNAHC